MGARGPDLWVMLLEKAYAAVYGGYDMLGGGSSQQAFGDLMGGSTTAINLEATGEKGYDQVAAGFAAKRPVVCNTVGEVTITNKYKDDKDSLVPFQIITRRHLVGIPAGGHEWMVTGVDTASRKITIRNPHGGTNADITVASSTFVSLWASAEIGPAPAAAPPAAGRP
jgi:hypothetical protein